MNLESYFCGGCNEVAQETASVEISGGEMKRRRITLKDGRYLIFYTFESAPQPAPQTGAHDKQAEPHPEAQTPEERRV